jgi:sulfite exporter TauE/SafE
MIFLTAFLTGLFGSFHCAGMCGPIALATPNVGHSFWQMAASKLLYNSGRIFTYAILGSLFGSFGFGLKLAGLQQSISIAAGLIIILSVILSSSKLGKLKFNPIKYFTGNTISKLFQTKTYYALFAIGLLNGLLPCGFVYIGLIGSVATQNIWEGALFMMFFGLGTLPMMYGVSLVGQFLSITVRGTINKLTPYVAVTIGCLFIIRGLGLGIPYFSPQINTKHTINQDCGKTYITNSTNTD